MPCVVQVCDDGKSNLMHLLAEVRDEKSHEKLELKSVEPVAFIQTSRGVESLSTGVARLPGDSELRHRFSGPYKGGKEEYIKAVDKGGAPKFSAEGMLKSPADLKKGSGGWAIKVSTLKQLLKKSAKSAGRVASVGGIAIAVTLTLAQVCGLWKKFTADGVLTQEEKTRMGLELSHIFNPVHAVAEFGEALYEDKGILEVAAQPSLRDDVVNGALDYVQDGCEQACDGAGLQSAAAYMGPITSSVSPAPTPYYGSSTATPYYGSQMATISSVSPMATPSYGSSTASPYYGSSTATPSYPPTATPYYPPTGTPTVPLTNTTPTTFGSAPDSGPVDPSDNLTDPADLIPDPAGDAGEGIWDFVTGVFESLLS